MAINTRTMGMATITAMPTAQPTRTITGITMATPPLTCTTATARLATLRQA